MGEPLIMPGTSWAYFKSSTVASVLEDLWGKDPATEGRRKPLMAPVLELNICDGPLFDFISDDLLLRKENSSFAAEHNHLLNKNLDSFESTDTCNVTHLSNIPKIYCLFIVF